MHIICIVSSFNKLISFTTRSAFCCQTTNSVGLMVHVSICLYYHNSLLINKQETKTCFELEYLTNLNNFIRMICSNKLQSFFPPSRYTLRFTTTLRTLVDYSQTTTYISLKAFSKDTKSFESAKFINSSCCLHFVHSIQNSHIFLLENKNYTRVKKKSFIEEKRNYFVV